MATAIKTLLLRSVKTALETVTDFKFVYLNPERGLREEAPKPYCNIFSQPETAKKEDVWREGQFELSIHIWVQEDTSEILDERLQDLVAKVQMAMLPRCSPAREYVTYLEETGDAFDTLFFGDGMGVGLSTYLVKYKHTYGNPFELNPST